MLDSILSPSYRCQILSLGIDLSRCLLFLLSRSSMTKHKMRATSRFSYGVFYLAVSVLQVLGESPFYATFVRLFIDIRLSHGNKHQGQFHLSL